MKNKMRVLKELFHFYVAQIQIGPFMDCLESKTEMNLRTKLLRLFRSAAI